MCKAYGQLLSCVGPNYYSLAYSYLDTSYSTFQIAPRKRTAYVRLNCVKIPLEKNYRKFISKQAEPKITIRPIRLITGVHYNTNLFIRRFLSAIRSKTLLILWFN